jgi:hypothetical protein
VGVKWLGVNRGPKIGKRSSTVQMPVENTKQIPIPNEFRQTVLIFSQWQHPFDTWFWF